MKDDSKFWEIVDGVEINSKKIVARNSLWLILSLFTGLLLLVIGVATNPFIGLVGFLVALFGINKHIGKRGRG